MTSRRFIEIFGGLLGGIMLATVAMVFYQWAVFGEKCANRGMRPVSVSYQLCAARDGVIYYVGQ
jgi:hypothetical protein